MRKSTALVIKKAAEQLDLSPIEIYEDYSGRAMYGQKTTGLVASDFCDIIAAVAAAGGELEPGSSELDDLIEDCQRLRSDSLGCQVIVY